MRLPCWRARIVSLLRVFRSGSRRFTLCTRASTAKPSDELLRCVCRAPCSEVVDRSANTPRLNTTRTYQLVVVYMMCPLGICL